MDVILSIKPKYVDAILMGKKRYEFRKNIFKNKNINHIYIYSSSPVKKIVAVFRIGEIIEDEPRSLWEKCKDLSGLDDKEFFKYFMDNRKGFAIEIDSLELLKTPIDPKEIMPGFVPPQSFCYVDTHLLPKSNNIYGIRTKYYANNRAVNQTKPTCQENLAKFI